MNLESIDLLIRGGVIAFAAAGAAQIFGKPLSGKRRAKGFHIWAWALLAGGVSIYAMVSAPYLLAECNRVCDGLRIIPAINPFLLWWAGLSLFDDRFRPRPWHFIPAALMFSPIIAEAAAPLRTGAVLVMFGHLIVVTVTTAGDDLVEERMTFRRYFLGLSTIFGLAITAVEVLASEPFPPRLYLVQSCALLVLTGAFLLWSTRSRPEIWERRLPQSFQTNVSATPLLRALQSAMQEGIWQEEGLTIGRLAARIDAPEHRVRKLINAELGHRNFSAFINERRIAFAREALLRQPDEPVLAIAYESGFASLGPFNRAFRESEGMSPTEFRKTSLADPENR